MATYTSYLNLEKPTTSETFNLLKMNQNWDKIDAGVSALNRKITIASSDITFTEGTTRADIAKCYKTGNMVFLTMNNVGFTNGYSSGDIDLATLPYAPTTWVRFIGYTVQGETVLLGISPAGHLLMSSGLKEYVAGSLIYVSCCYATAS